MKLSESLTVSAICPERYGFEADDSKKTFGNCDLILNSKSMSSEVSYFQVLTVISIAGCFFS